MVHDLGKVLCLYGEPQWAVVGDTFPVGCAWSDPIVFPEYFAANPDNRVPEYQTIYEPHCGLDKVNLSWGHDEYIYRVTRNYLPKPAQSMLRYRPGAHTGWLQIAERNRTPRWAMASMWGARFMGLRRMAPTQSQRNWSETIRTPFGRSSLRLVCGGVL